MAITCVQGTPGSGKSAFAVSRALDHLRRGGIVAANFSLTDGWADIVAEKSFRCRFLRFDPHEYACDLHDRFRVVGSLEGVKRATSELIPRAHGSIAKEYEGHGLLILDECQLIFNSRNWQKNMKWIEWFSQHRKHKWDVLMLTHSVEMVDSQIRNYIEYDARFRNLNKVKLPVIKIPASKLLLTDNAFLSIWRYYGISAGSGVIFKRDLDKLTLWEARLYDSMRVFSIDESMDDYAEAGCRPVLRRRHSALNVPSIRSFFDDVALTTKSKGPVTVLNRDFLKGAPDAQK